MADESIGEQHSGSRAENCPSQFSCGAQDPEKREKQNDEQIKKASGASTRGFNFRPGRSFICAPGCLNHRHYSGVDSSIEITRSESRRDFISYYLAAARVC
jgi:hypothetical protein